MENTNVTDTNSKNSVHNIRAEILWRRYLMKDELGKVVETEQEMFRRVANAIAAIESKYGATKEQIECTADEFYEFMATGVFLPNSPTLMNAGRPNGMLSACFVVPVPDSITGIFEAVKYTAMIQKSGGGTGFAFDRLRPTGDLVASSGGRTSGPLSFMKVFSGCTDAIQQGAFRRGANMGMMSIDHPDIVRFIHAKMNPEALPNFNISVKVTDAFMQKLRNEPDEPHIVLNPHTSSQYVIPRNISIDSYTIDNLIPAEQATSDCHTVGEIWRMIVATAHAAGEPGISFIDRVNRGNPTPHIGQINATNPCGEQPLLDYEACNLGSVDVSKFILPDGSDIDWPHLSEVVEDCVGFLDNVIDANRWPIPEIQEMTLGNRKIGLGLMGFADALILLSIRYDSEEALCFAEDLSEFIQKRAHIGSQELAEIRGCFPNWEGSTWDTEHKRPMRNAGVTTIAPTGTISLIAYCSSGIEPIFSFATKRRALDGEEFFQLHPLVERLGTREGWLTNRVRELLAQGVSPGKIPGIPRELADVLVTAHEVAPEWHVKIQAAFQKYTDNAVSKTVNLPAEATIDDVDKVYRLAYELGSKGITVYRDGCRENQVITTAHKISQSDASTVSPRPRPKKTDGTTIKAKTGCGSLFVTINKDEEGLFEIFTNLGKAGGCPSQSEATARILSVALRCGIGPETLVEQLKGIRCLSTIARRKGGSDIDVLSCPDAIARAIEATLGGNCESLKISPVNRCPDCGYPMRRDSGCNICDNCGYDKCG